MAIRYTAKRELRIWRNNNKCVQAGDSFTTNSNNNSSYYLKQAIEKNWGVSLTSSSSSTPSENDWVIEKL